MQGKFSKDAVEALLRVKDQDHRFSGVQRAASQEAAAPTTSTAAEVPAP